MAFIKALIFDLDNTLFDRDSVARRVLFDMGLDPYMDELMAADAGGVSDRLGFAACAVSIANLDQTPKEFWASFRDNLANSTQWDAQVRAMLKRLARKYRLGILSNGGSSNQRIKARNLGVEDIVNALVISGDHPFQKPDAQAFLYTCNLLGCPPENTLMIGNDYQTDFLGAKAAGLNALMVGKTMGEASVVHVLEVEAWLLTHARSSAS